MEILNTTHCSQKPWTLVRGSSLCDTYNYAIHTKKGTPLGVSFFYFRKYKEINNITHYYLIQQKKTIPPQKRLSIQLSIISKLSRNLH